MEEKELAAGRVLEHPIGSLRWNAQRLLTGGEVQSVRELADRLDGKPAQAVIGGDDDEPAVKVDATIRRIIVGPEEAK